VVVGTLFTLMLMIGFYARLAGLEVDAQDTVVREYLLHEFGSSAWGEYVLVFIFITLLAAGMSTLDGILVALSAMVVNDIVRPLAGETQRRPGPVALGAGGGGRDRCALAWNPPPLIGLFAQKGVYGLAAASLVPVLFGVLVRRHIPLWVVMGAAGHRPRTAPAVQPVPSAWPTPPCPRPTASSPRCCSAWVACRDPRGARRARPCTAAGAARAGAVFFTS
jgi:sodium/pantothenate symporter